MKLEDIVVDCKYFKNIPTEYRYLTSVHINKNDTFDLGYTMINDSGQRYYCVEKNVQNNMFNKKRIENELLATFRYVIQLNSEETYKLVEFKTSELYENFWLAIKYFLGTIVGAFGISMVSYSASNFWENSGKNTGILILGLLFSCTGYKSFLDFIGTLKYKKRYEQELREYIFIEGKSYTRK